MARMQPSAPRDVLQGVHNSITDMVKAVANEPSVGLCSVQQHVHKARPGLGLAFKERGTRKEPGRSRNEVDDNIHDFVVGDTIISHPEPVEIYAELKRLTEIIKAEGYIPDTRLVLQNIGEEDKELALFSHSEKLAIAFGLIHTPRGKSIRVYKNLRLCSDCHTATKFSSKVTGREVVARDTNRFHHPKDGVCSCDYW